jgi:N-acylneuraminate cytidylyltransferase
MAHEKYATVGRRHGAVAIIPARGNSKGIPRKNLIDFCGRPLLSWSILQARAAETVDAVYVSSDNDEILDVAEREGAVPIRRPAEFATDTATSESALAHAIEKIEATRQEAVSIVVFLQTTSPLREPGDIDAAVRKMDADAADSLFSGARAEHLFLWEPTETGMRSVNFDWLHRRRRQDMTPQYYENGNLYLFRPQVLRTHNNRFGGKIAVVEMPWWKSWEIDTTEDVELCTWYFRERLLQIWSTRATLMVGPEVRT